MAENKTLDQNVAEANYAKRENEREAAGGGRSLSPSDAAGMGANADQAKMANFKKPGALDEAMQQAKAQKSVAQEQMFDAIERERNIEEEQLTDEQRAAEKLTKDMEGLGSLDSLVQRYTEDAFSKTQEIEFETVDEALNNLVSDKEFTDEDGNPISTPEYVDAGIKEYNKIVQGLSGLEGAAKIAAIREANNVIKGLQEEGALKGDTAAVDLIGVLAETAAVDPETAALMTAQAFADGILDPAEMTLDYLMKTDFMKDSSFEDAFGMDEDGLTSILGEGFKDMTVQEIAAVVENETLTNIHKSANIAKTLTDPNVSPVLKEALKGQQAQIEASGFAAIEQDASDAAAKVMASGSVLFGGEVRDIKELLADSNITGMVSEYLNMDEDSRKDSDFFKKNSGFANAMEQTFKEALELGENLDEAIGVLLEDNENWQAGIAKDESDIAEVTKGLIKAVPPKLKELLGVGLNGIITDPDADKHPLWELAKTTPSVMISMASWSEDTIESFGEWMNSTDPAPDMEAMTSILSDESKAEAFFDIQDATNQLNSIQIDPSNPAASTGPLMKLLLGQEGQQAALDAGLVANGNFDTFYDQLVMEAATGNTNAAKTLKKLGPVISKDGKPLVGKELKAAISGALGGGTEDMSAMMDAANNLDSSRENMRKSTKHADTDRGDFPGAYNKKEVRDRALSSGMYKNGRWDLSKVSSMKDADADVFLESLAKSGMCTDPDLVPMLLRRAESQTKELDSRGDEAFKKSWGAVTAIQDAANTEIHNLSTHLNNVIGSQGANSPEAISVRQRIQDQLGPLNANIKTAYEGRISNLEAELGSAPPRKAAKIRALIAKYKGKAKGRKAPKEFATDGASAVAGQSVVNPEDSAGIPQPTSGPFMG